MAGIPGKAKGDTTHKDFSPEEHFHDSCDSDSSSDYSSSDHDGTTRRAEYRQLKRKIENLEIIVNKLRQNPEKKKKSTDLVKCDYTYKQKVNNWKLTFDETMADQVCPSVQLRKKSYEMRSRSSLTDSSDLKIEINLDETSVIVVKEFYFPPTISVALKNPVDIPGIRKTCIRVCDLGYDCQIIRGTYRYVFPREMVEANADEERNIGISIHVTQPKVSSTNGIVRWAMSGYAMNAALIRDGYLSCVEGPTFYTSRGGYRIKIKMVLGNVVRAIVQLVAGEYDEDRAKSFCHLTTVTIFNKWDCLSSHITQSAVNDFAKIDSYEIELATHEKLDKGGFLIDDTLHILVDISEISF